MSRAKLGPVVDHWGDAGGTGGRWLTLVLFVGAGLRLQRKGLQRQRVIAGVGGPGGGQFGAPYPIQVSTAFVGYVKALESAHTQGDSFRARKKTMTMTILLNGTHSIS